MGVGDANVRLAKWNRQTTHAESVRQKEKKPQICVLPILILLWYRVWDDWLLNCICCCCKFSGSFFVGSTQTHQPYPCHVANPGCNPLRDQAMLKPMPWIGQETTVGEREREKEIEFVTCSSVATGNVEDFFFAAGSLANRWQNLGNLMADSMKKERGGEGRHAQDGKSAFPRTHQQQQLALRIPEMSRLLCTKLHRDRLQSRKEPFLSGPTNTHQWSLIVPNC